MTDVSRDASNTHRYTDFDAVKATRQRSWRFRQAANSQLVKDPKTNRGDYVVNLIAPHPRCADIVEKLFPKRGTR